MEKRKSNWKWWLGVLGLISPFVTSISPPGPTVEDLFSGICGGIMFYFIGWVIDTNREKRWKKQDEITDMRRTMNHQAKEIRDVKIALGKRYIKISEGEEEGLKNGEYVIIDGEMYKVVNGGEE